MSRQADLTSALTHHSIEELCLAVERLAREAGALILTHYEGAPEVMSKADSSPVTRADQEANDLIVTGLKALTPQVPIVAEESVAAGEVPTLEEVREFFWLVDPLDGTKEFINQNGDFTVNIALIERGTPVMGVVCVPALNMSYLGMGEGRAFRRASEIPKAPKEGEGALEPIHTRPCPEKGAVVMTSRSHKSPETSAFLSTLNAPQEHARGSSLKLCLIATGEADFYPRFGRTMEWDIAAGHAVLRAAGGCVETLKGSPLTYAKNELFENPHFIARG